MEQNEQKSSKFDGREFIRDFLCKTLSDPANQKKLICAIHEQEDEAQVKIAMRILWGFVNANLSCIRKYRWEREHPSETPGQ